MLKALPNRSIVCLLGPTAIGKTDLALRLAERLPIEIISVDSALVYQGMDIGTAKPDPDSLYRVPHHLIDILPPDQPYSAGAFCRDALAAIGAIETRQRIPLLVGGTMLYFKSLQQGLGEGPVIPAVVRESLQEAWLSQGPAALYDELCQVDPALAERLHPNDKQRILRGLEVFRATGQKLSLFQKAVTKQDVIHFVNIIIWPKCRIRLQQRINDRFQAMLAGGFIEEVQALRDNYRLDASMNSMKAVGYRQVWEYLEGQLTLSELRERGSAATRQLAKRQLTWLRSWPDAIVLADDDPALVDKLFVLLQPLVTGTL